MGQFTSGRAVRAQVAEGCEHVSLHTKQADTSTWMIVCLPRQAQASTSAWCARVGEERLTRS
jgi:hypothetical protein